MVRMRAANPRRFARTDAIRVGALLGFVLVMAACGRVSDVDPRLVDPDAAPIDPVAWFSASVGYEAPAVVVPSEAPNPLVVEGSGADIWFERDGFFFVYTELEGDGYIEARLASFDAPHE